MYVQFTPCAQEGFGYLSTENVELLKRGHVLEEIRRDWPDAFHEIAVLNNFAKLTGKHLQWRRSGV